MNEIYRHPHYDLIKDIFHKQFTAETETSAKATLETLANLGFEGLLKGKGAYRAWDCDSWLDNSIRKAIQQCENHCGVSFSKIVETLWSKMDPTSTEDRTRKKNLIESYLLLPIPEYKTPGPFDKDDFKFSDFQEIWEELNREWRGTGDADPIDIDQALPLPERFKMYLTSSHFPETIKPYLGSRISPQEEMVLLTLLEALDKDRQSKIWNAFAQSRMPFWNRLAKRLS